MLRVEVMWVSLKTEKRRSHCPVFSFRPRVRRAEGLPGMTTEDLHGNERRSAPPANGRRWSALLPLICMVIPDHSSFSVLRETHMTFACRHFKKPKCYGICSLGSPKNSYSSSQREAICLFPLFMNPTIAPGFNEYMETFCPAGVWNSAWAANL